MRRGIFRILGIGLWCFFLLQPFVWAQRDTGTITGTVRDESGAVIPGVAITVTHTQTNISFNTVTGDAGTYTAPALRVGDYAVSADFSTFLTTRPSDRRRHREERPLVPRHRAAS